MKKMRFLTGGAIVLSCVLTLNSCEGFDLNSFLEDLNPDNENVEGDEDDEGSGLFPGGGGTAELLTPTEQKAKLEKVGVKLLEKCPAEDVEDFFAFYEAFVKEYMEREDYDIEALYEWSEEELEKFGPGNTAKHWFDPIKGEEYEGSVVDITVLLSNHRGEFTFGKNAVTKKANSSFDGVKLNIPLRGKNYEARLVSSGKVTKAYYHYMYYSSYESSWYDGYWDDEKSVWVPAYFDYTTGEWIPYDKEKVKYIWEDDFKFNIGVPENIEVGLYEDGKPMATIHIKTKQSFTAAGLNPAVDNFDYDINVFFNNGYELIMQDVAYDGAKSNASFGMTFKKDGQSLVSGAAAGSVNIENAVYEYQYSYDDDYEEARKYTTVKVNHANNINLLVDILGEVQFKGTCSDAEELNEAIDNYYDALSYWDDSSTGTAATHTPDEVAAARYLNNINAKLDLNVYYDNDYSKKQARVEFEMNKYKVDWDPNDDGNYDNDYYYDLMPVIVFNDNSRYTIDDYFTEEAFEHLLEKADGFAADYEELFGEYFDDLFVKDDVPTYHPEYPGTEYPEGTR